MIGWPRCGKFSVGETRLEEHKEQRMFSCGVPSAATKHSFYGTQHVARSNATCSCVCLGVLFCIGNSVCAFGAPWKHSFLR